MNTGKTHAGGGEGQSPTKIVREWWGVIIVVVGMIGGYVWLEATYAKVEMLEAERDSLNGEINELRCRLHYTIELNRSEIETRRYDELYELMRSEYDSLDDVARTTSRATNLTDEMKRTNERLCRLRAAQQCQEDRLSQCYEGGSYEPGSCREEQFRAQCE